MQGKGKGIHKGQMRKIVRKAVENRFIIILSLLALGIFYAVNLRPGIIKGSDDSFHLCRLEGLAVDLSYGVFPVKVHSPLCFGYGYGVGIFYQNHLLYFPALLRVAGVSLELTYKIFSGCIMTAIYGSAFYAAYRISKDKYAALVAAVCVLFSWNMVSDFYLDFHMAGSMAMIFIPLAIAGMLDFLLEDKKPVLLGAGFLGLICTHILSAYLTFFVCAAIALSYAGRWVNKPKKIGEGILAVGGTLALSISFWLPMLEQFRVQEYKVSRPWTQPEEHTQLLFSLFGQGGMGWLLFLWILAILLFLTERGKKVKQRGLLYRLMGIVFFLFFANASEAFWRLTKPVTGMVQFPVRLFTVGSVLAAFSVAVTLSEIRQEKRKKGIALINFLGAAYFFISALDGVGIETLDLGDKAVYEAWAGISAGEEWLPVETTREMLTDATLAVADDGTQARGRKEKGRFHFTMDMEKGYYDIPFVYYRGYAAQTQEGSRLEVGKNTETSMVRVWIREEDRKGGGSHEVTVWYDGTKIQRLSYIVNLLALAAMAAVWQYLRRQRSRRNEEEVETGARGSVR